ncbi:hypothetical protein B0H10DRAFT_1959754 [Mycena sp. CBHHK59/15]|nr:hypothetical protein B0H10DRAFT_1959754 [Mycena sp. CBHHK59/15]
MWRRPLSRALQRSAVEYHPELVAGHASDATAFIDIQQMLQAPSSWSSTTTGHNSPSQTTNVVHKFILTASTEQQFEFWVPEKAYSNHHPRLRFTLAARRRQPRREFSFLLPPSSFRSASVAQQTRRETKRAANTPRNETSISRIAGAASLLGTAYPAHKQPRPRASQTCREARRESSSHKGTARNGIERFEE